MRFTALPAALLLMAVSATAQDLTRKAPAQKAPIALVGGTVHTVSGDVIEDGYVLFDGGRITEVGRRAGKTFAEAVRVKDVRGKHVYPGLIDPNTSLGLVEIGAVRATHDFNEVGGITPEVRAAVAVNPDSTLIPVTRSNGILTAAVLPSGGTIAGRASIMRLDGWTWETMAVRADAGLVVNWPVTRPIRAWWMDETDEEQMKKARLARRRVRSAFEQAKAYLAARDADPSTPLDARWEAMRGALQGVDGKRQLVFIHAQNYDQIVPAVAFCAEHGLRGVIVGGRDAHLCSALLKRHDGGVILNGTFRMPKRNDSDYDAIFTLPARLEAAGVRWCMSSGDRASNVRNLPYTAALAVAYGLDKDVALRALTLRTAQMLGVGDELGSIEKGKSATLIVTDGSPLEMTTHVERAWIDGREIDLSNKQTELRDKYREKYRQLGLLPDQG